MFVALEVKDQAVSSEVAEKMLSSIDQLNEVVDVTSHVGFYA